VTSASGERRDDPHHAAANPAFLKILLRKIERPMLILSFIWFLVVIAELVNGISAFLLVLGTALWALLIMHFCLRFAIVVDKKTFLRRNWLFILAIAVPMLRLLPFVQTLPLARALTATFGIQVVWILASADQGLRSLRRAMGRRGVGYALTFTAIVLMAGAAGMLHFENASPDPQGIHSYPRAIWWVAMQITTIGSGYQPITRGGLALCLGISVFAAAIFGYLTAVFATVIIGRDAADPKSEIPNQTSILQLSKEIALLRASVEDALSRVPGAAPRPVHPAPSSEAANPIKHGKPPPTATRPPL
jgi:voltage-gated potassium channel